MESTKPPQAQELSCPSRVRVRCLPLEADTAFGMVAQAAQEIGVEAIARQAATQQEIFLARRRAAAGDHWGGVR